MYMNSTEMQEVDFIVLKEDYSRFLVHDGTTLKVKIVVRKIFCSPQKTPEGYPSIIDLDSMNAVAAIVPPGLKGPSSKEPFNPQKEKPQEIKFEEQEIKIQEYTTTNGYKISIKPVVVKVFKYNQRNAYGEPVYTVSIQTITNIDKIGTTTS